jgi:hypothetical protein
MTIITSNESIWMAEMSLCLVGQSLSHGDLEGNFCLECVQRWEGGLRGLTSFFCQMTGDAVVKNPL